MPPVEFDTIPRAASYTVQEIKDVVNSNDVLELGSFEPIITRSKGISLEDSGIIEDVGIPEVDSEDETTIAKIMKEYSEESVDDADYIPSEDSVDDLEYDTNASVSEDDLELLVIEDVKIPEASAGIIYNVPVCHFTDDSFSELNAIANNIVDYVVGYSIIQTGIKALYFCLDICEKILSPMSISSKERVQVVRRYLRAIRRSGSGFTIKVIESSRKKCLRNLPARKSNELRESSFFGYYIEMFEVNWFLSLVGMTLTFVPEPACEKRNALDDQDYSDDDETTVFKLMKDYGSQDDVDYIPSDTSFDSMEFYSDFSDDETIIDKLLKDYSSIEDSDYIPCDESEDSLEYNSDEDAKISQDCSSSDDYMSDCSEDETIIDKIMMDYSDESEDDDYIPGDEIEDDIEYDSNAPASEIDSDVADETQDSEEESQENEICVTEVCEQLEHEVEDELSSQDTHEDEEN